MVEDKGNVAVGRNPSYLVPHFQSDAWCIAFHMKTNFHSHANKTHCYMKGCAPCLARQETTRKWFHSIDFSRRRWQLHIRAFISMV